jgi:hypothetical protein
MMRKYIILILCSLLVLGIAAGCGDSKEKDGTSFTARVLETGETHLLVEPVEGSSELNSADRISVYIGDVAIVDDEGKEITIQDIGVGDNVQIHYDGRIAESYPAQIHGCHKVVLVK